MASAPAAAAAADRSRSSHGAGRTMGVSRRRSASARGADLISSLGDDLLVRILELLPDAADAVRTGELSRRWRGLWRRVRFLTFDSTTSARFRRASGARRFLAFVGSALAQRATAHDDAALQHLAISFLMGPVGQQTEQLVSQSSRSAQEWILYAFQGRVRSFVLELRLPMMSDEEERTMINLSQHSSSANLQSVHWKLDGVAVQLPVDAAFTSLADLWLEDFEVAAGNLARFLSSACCPRLQKLHLRKLMLLRQGTNLLKVEVSTLLELSCEEMQGAWVLELKTPSLRVLHLVDRRGYLETLRISAPRLEEVTFSYDKSMLVLIDGDELPCVRSLKTELQSHDEAFLAYGDEPEYAEYYDINDSCIYVLECCTSVTCLEVSLGVPQKTDDLTSGRIPHLKHVVSLTVDVSLPDLHSFGLGLVDLLAQCSNLKYFRVYCSLQKMLLLQSREHDYLCNHEVNREPDQIQLHDIEEVECTGLAGTGCERWFLGQVIAHATNLQKVTLSLNPMCKLAEENDKYIRRYSEYIPGGGGTWICHEPRLSYEWKPDP